MQLNGRTVIRTDEEVVNASNVVKVLKDSLFRHYMNRSQIDYLWNYYRGIQPICKRVKEVRPEICNKIVENRANEIVEFKSGYLMGEPVQYVARSADEADAEVTEAINTLNDYVFSEEKQSKDKELADWFHICGTSFRLILPDPKGEEDDAPFEINTLDPRNTFVVYHNGVGEKPVLGVNYVVDFDGVTHFSCYTKDEYFEIVGEGIVNHQYHVLGHIPIVEYPLNLARLGAFELVIPLLDAINTVDSNRIDGVEQFVQALMLFHNVDITSEDFDALRERGAIKFKDIDPAMKAEIKYLINNLPQGETQCLTDHMYQTVLTICGMPSQGNGQTSDSSNNGAVILRNGWQSAEARAKDTEMMFKKSERQFLKILLRICSVLRSTKLKVSQIEIRFTRRNYENIYQKAQVLDLMLRNPMIHPRLAFAHSGMFADAELAYTMSQEWYEEQQKKAEEQQKKAEEQQMKMMEMTNANNKGNGNTDRGSSGKGQSGGSEGGKGSGSDSRDKKKAEK